VDEFRGASAGQVGQIPDELRNPDVHFPPGTTETPRKDRRETPQRPASTPRSPWRSESRVGDRACRSTMSSETRGLRHSPSDGSAAASEMNDRSLGKSVSRARAASLSARRSAIPFQPRLRLCQQAFEFEKGTRSKNEAALVVEWR